MEKAKKGCFMKKDKSRTQSRVTEITSQNPTRSEDSCGLAWGGSETPGTPPPSTGPGARGAQVLGHLNRLNRFHPLLYGSRLPLKEAGCKWQHSGKRSLFAAGMGPSSLVTGPASYVGDGRGFRTLQGGGSAQVRAFPRPLQGCDCI